MKIPRTLLLSIVLAAGCAPMAEIEIQVMDPAEITLPLNVHQLAFMNRSVYPQLLNTDSVWTPEEFHILDTIVHNWIFFGLMESLAESPLFDLDEIKVVQVRRADTSGILKPLEPADMRRLKTMHPADAVISLEYYDINDSVDVDLNLDNFLYEAYMGFYTTTVWRIYDLEEEKVFDKFILQDTVDWNAWDESYNGALKELPRAIDAIRAAAYYTGINYGKRISPAWMEVHRYYHTSGGKQMREAGRIADSGDWQAASALWSGIASGKDQKVAAKACFNMALAREMEDLLVPALDWAVKSYSIRQDPLTREYIDLLKQRYEDWKKLRMQLPSME